MANNDSNIEIIGEDHRDLAGITLLRQRAKNASDGYAVMIEWSSYMNGIIKAYYDDKISKKELSDIFYAQVHPKTRVRVPKIVDMLEEFKSQKVPVIAYDPRNNIDALDAQMDPKSHFTAKWNTIIKKSIEINAPTYALDRDRAFVDAAITYWNYSPLTKEIEDYTRVLLTNGITNEDVIAASIIDKFHQRKSTVLAGALHINGEVHRDIPAYGIVDNALRKLGHVVETTIAMDNVGHFVRAGFLENCQTSEVIGSYVVINPLTGATEKIYHDSESVRWALLEKIIQSNMNYPLGLASDHLGNCTPDKYPVADQHPEFSPILQKLKDFDPKDKFR